MLVFNQTKTAFMLLTIFIMLMVLTPLAQAQGLTDTVRGTTASGEDIVEKADKVGLEFVNVLRALATIAAIIFIAWAGIIFWGAGGNPQKMTEAKGKLLYFFIALILIFMAENIFATLAKFFGFSI